MNPAPPALGERRFPEAADVRVGQPRRQRAAEHPVPGVLQHQRDAGLSISLTKVAGPPHAQDRVLQHPQLQGGSRRTGTDSVRHAQLRAGHRRHQPVRHVVRIRQRGHRHLQLVPAGLEVRRRQPRLRQPRGLHPGQLEGQQPAHARLRRAASCTRRRSTTPGPGLAISCRTRWSLSASAASLYRPGCAVTVRRVPRARRPVGRR